THPLVVPRVQGYLANTFGADDAARRAWAAHWFHQGLLAYEAMLPHEGAYCWGATPTLADCCLASHVAGAERFGVDLTPFLAVRRIHDACMALPAFSAAHPLKQPGAPAAA
ncbi:MAG: maleylacetoacetate isomerase, partial [Gemmatimonadaceae bacterium]|nr:maleylacetoacetate isomerase [Acetobacteraceae bacterium]